MPYAAATWATAGLSFMPPAVRARTSSTAVSRSIVRGGAPATTRVTSPRTSPLAQADQLGQRAATDLLVGLGELPADRRRPVRPEGLDHRRQGLRGAVRRLEEHHGAGLGGQFVEPPGPLAGLARQETLEAEAVDRQAGDGQRGQHRRRSGHRGDPDARVGRGVTSRYPGSETDGIPASVTCTTRAPSSSAPHQLVGPRTPRCPRSRTRSGLWWRCRAAPAAGAAAGCPRPRSGRRRPAPRRSRGEASADVTDGRRRQHQRRPLGRFAHRLSLPDHLDRTSPDPAGAPPAHLLWPGDAPGPRGRTRTPWTPLGRRSGRHHPAAPPVPAETTVQRLRVPMPADRITGWVVTLLITGIAVRHAGGQSGLPQQAGLRRDLLRQGRVRAAEVRLRAQLAEQRQRQDHRGQRRT